MAALPAQTLLRERLLGRLPDTPGRVVWLQAPYGYGKSVLAGHWAARLEAVGWRSIWLTAGGLDPRPLLAHRLGLPETAPWHIVRESLAERPTLVVLEDLEGGEPLSPLLRDPPGLVLLASRRPLAEPELPRLAGAGRLLHLDAAALAFDPAEARALFLDPERAGDAWQRTGGWPLLLHLTALTGGVADDLGPGVLAGMRESLAPEAWNEALLLAAVERLPAEAHVEATVRLAASGFAQRAAGSVRLHPLLAALLRSAHGEAVQAAVRQAAARLPKLIRGAAFETAGLTAELATLLDAEPELARVDPAAVLRWDASAGGRRGWLRGTQVGQALCLRGRLEEGVAALREALAAAGDAVEPRLLAAKELIWNLALLDRTAARSLAESLEPDLARADGELAGRFLSDAGRIAYLDGDYAAAEAMTVRALERYPAESPRRIGALVNLGILGFEGRGELDRRIASAEEALASAETWIPEHVPGIHLDLARLHLLLGARSRALEHLAAASAGAKARPWINLSAEAVLAALSGRPEALATPLARLRLWNDAETLDATLGLCAWTLTGLDRAAEALALLDGAEGVQVGIARALAFATRDGDRSLARLPDAATLREREPRLYHAAARFRIGGDPRDLDRLLGLVGAGARVLPGLVPLAALPRDRVELTRVYPLAQVLASGWKEAIAARLGEIAPLELTLLGGVHAARDGASIELAPRLQAIVVLLALGQGRERIADVMWPELAPAAARNNLHVNLNKLRRAVEPWGVATHVGEASLLHASSDLEQLEAALRAGDAGRVAVLFTGELAPELDLEPVREARERLHRAVVACLAKAAATLPAAEAEPLLARVLELEPLHEPALQGLLRLLARSGRRARALELYERFRERLGNEVGARPLPATRAAVDG